MKETKYVAFSTQKGGAGKTTLTVLVASYLHYVKGYDVAVIDCDFPQYRHPALTLQPQQRHQSGLDRGIPLLHHREDREGGGARAGGAVGAKYIF